jgi:hypothetical protein
MYAQRDYKSLERELDKMSASDKAFVLPVAVGFLINNPNGRSPESVKSLVHELTAISLNDGSMSKDAYARGAATTYNLLAEELVGAHVNWSSACAAPLSEKNSCICRHALLQDQIPKIDAESDAPELDRALWIAKSGATYCKSYDYPFQLFASVIEFERSPAYDDTRLTQTIRDEYGRDKEKANFVLCALRRQYLDYSKSRLNAAEERGVFSCPTPVNYN